MVLRIEIAISRPPDGTMTHRGQHPGAETIDAPSQRLACIVLEMHTRRKRAFLNGERPHPIQPQVDQGSACRQFLEA